MHSIVATRSLALRSVALECWPDGTVHTRDDVIFHGASLMGVAQTEPTPAVRIGVAGGLLGEHAVHPRQFITVVLTRVEQITHPEGSRRPELWVDAELDRCQPILAAARLIGRESSARRKRMQLRPNSADGRGWARLPVDIVAGDFLAVPCDGATPLSSVCRYTRHQERLGDDRVETAEDDFPYLPSCLK